MPKLQEEVTYLLYMKDGSLKKVTVPADWSVTFGALYPGKEGNMGKTGLRFWKGKVQKAVFTEVEAFRDTSIKIEERVTTTKQETFYKGDGENQKAVVVEGQVHEWVNPDEPRPQPKEEAHVAQLRVVNLD